ncbi:unnamed protein product [Caenorhabditis brenneri]
MQPNFYEERDALLQQGPIPGTETYHFSSLPTMPCDRNSVDCRVAEEELETAIKNINQSLPYGDVRMNEKARNHLIYLYTEIADYKKKLAEHQIMLEESELLVK